MRTLKKGSLVPAGLLLLMALSARLDLIPQPVNRTASATGTTCLLTPPTRLVVSEPVLQNSTLFFNSYLRQHHRFTRRTASGEAGQLVIRLGVQQKGNNVQGSFRLPVERNVIGIRGGNSALGF